MIPFPRTLQQIQMMKNKGSLGFMYVLFSLKMYLSLNMRIFQEVLYLIFLISGN
jgi:hypothetical protein